MQDRQAFTLQQWIGSAFQGCRVGEDAPAPPAAGAFPQMSTAEKEEVLKQERERMGASIRNGSTVWRAAGTVLCGNVWPCSGTGILHASPSLEA